MTITEKVRFSTDDLSEVKEKIDAFETLYGVTPKVYVQGRLFTNKKIEDAWNEDKKVAYGPFTLYDYKEVRDIRNKYISLMLDGKLDEKVKTNDESIDLETTNWELVGKINK